MKNLSPIIIKILKGLGIALGGVAVIAGGIQTYALISGNEDFDIYQRIMTGLKGLKNEPIGCCLPLCGESGETVCQQSVGSDYKWINSPCSALSDCKKVCCYPHGEMSKAECEHMGITNYTEGECKEGYKASPHGTHTETSEYGITMTWVFTLDVYTCDDDPNNAIWKGEYDWDWRTVDAEGNKGYDDAEDSVTFTTNDGYGTFYLGGQTQANVQVSTESMTVTWDMAPLGTIRSEGALFKGDERCLQEKNQ